MTDAAPPPATAVGRSSTASTPWWLNPAVVVLLVVPVTVWVSLRLTDRQYRDLYREPRYFSAATAELVLVATLVMAAAAVLVIATGRRGTAAAVEDPSLSGVLSRCSWVLFWLTVLGYAAFAVSGALHGVTLGAIVASFASQENYGGDFKAQFATVPGITTLTQVGIAFVVVALYTLRQRRDTRLVLAVVVVYLLALLRAYLMTERLALIELAAPLVTVLATGAVRHGGRARKTLVALLPLLFLPVLLLVFSAFEYSRSWQFFKTRTTLPFGEFMLLRLGGYYATSYNNGQIQLEHGTWPGRLPDQSLSAFWTAPGVGTVDLYGRLSAPAPPGASPTELLQRYLNPEFNNPGGLTTPFVDFGTTGGIVFWLLAGLVVGVLYRGLREGDITGSLLYPVAMTGLSDLPRLLYWTQGRVVPAVVALVVVSLVLHVRRRDVVRTENDRRRRRRSSSPPVLAGASAGKHLAGAETAPHVGAAPPTPVARPVA